MQALQNFARGTLLCVCRMAVADYSLISHNSQLVDTINDNSDDTNHSKTGLYGKISKQDLAVLTTG